MDCKLLTLLLHYAGNLLLYSHVDVAPVKTVIKYYMALLTTNVGCCYPV